MKRRFTILTAAFALLALIVLPGRAWADSETITFADLGLENGVQYLDPFGTNISVTFAGGQNDGKYYTTGSGIRTYGGGTITITANGNTVTTIETTFAGDSYAPASDDVWSCTGGSGTGTNGVNASWSGSATSIVMTRPSGSGHWRLQAITVTYTTSGSDLDESDLALVDAPVELEFDLYDNDDPQTISYTTSSTGAVTVSQSNYITATVNANNTITVTPVAVTNGPQTIIVSQAADDTYAAGSVTFTVDITDSTPTTGSDVTFLAGTDLGSTENNNSPDEMEKNGVTIHSTDAAFATAQYRIYSGSTTTISVTSGTITNIVFNGQSTSYPVNRLSVNDNNGNYTVNNNVGTWTGNSNEVSFSASGQARLSSIVVTVETSGTPDPTISASNVDIAFNATSGSITYTINNEPSPAGTLTAAVTDGNWLTLGQGTTSPIAFTCSANENTSARTATVTLTYTYNTDQTVSANVTITQAAAPVSYTTIPDLFAAATSTETPVYVTFNNWVVSGVSTNGKNVFVTDNNGNGFVIYYSSDMSDTYAAGDILSGTAISCTLKKYNGFAELINVEANDLTITTGGTVTVANVAMADLAGVNTGALLHYDNLTCSVDNSKYYLSDGTTTIQVYNALYAFEALENGKTYNITGIYQQYNNTKEILPRSAADIEEVEVPHSEYTLTVEPFENLELITFVNDEMVMEGDGAIQVTEGEQIMLSIVALEGYEIETLMVNGVNHVNDIADDFTYSFEMPGENVTISATAVEDVPVTPGTWVLTNLADLTVDDVFVIVGDNGDTYAMSNDKGTSVAPAAVAVTVVENTLSAEPAANLQWNISITEDGYTFYPNGETETWLYCTNSNNGVRVGTNTNNVFVLDNESGYLKNVATSRYIGIYNSQDWRCYTNTTGNIANQTFAFYKKVAEPTTESYTLDITGYEAGSNGGYYLIASPVTVNPADVEGMTEGTTFDLYYFDQTEDLEWRNYKTQTFNLVPGKGYLYAKQATTESEIFHFELTGTPYDGDGTIELDYTEGGDFAGWNLVGNPFGVEAYISDDYYVMNEDGTEIITGENELVEPMQGVFVIADNANDYVIFDPAVAIGPDFDKIVMNVSRNRGNVVDRAIVRFGQGGVLPKFQLNENSTKLYIVEGDNEYAVVRSANEGEMPVNFKASENGNYTLSVNAENVEMEYLHLIDNMTGADIDLLATPSYSFEARTNDYESRFRLVFSGNTNVGSSTSSETFAFFNGNSWVINNEGEATLQVIDMMGRVLSNEQFNGSYNNSLNLSAGVYVLRLSNGNAVKTQKVVVD